MSATGIVDSHVHLLPDKLAQKVRRFFEQHINFDLAFPLDHAVILERLAAIGIDTVWSLPYAHKPGVAEWLNSSSAEIKRQNNSRVAIVAGATIHPQDSYPAELLKKAFEEEDLQVLKLHCSVGNFSADDPALNEVWELVSRLAVPVIVHCGMAVSGHSTINDLSPVEKVAQNYPHAKIIIAHSAHPQGSAALDLVEKYPNIYTDLTPVVSEVVALPPARVQKLASKILFGTDAPNTALTAEQCLAHLRSWSLSAEAEAAILGDNARRLLPPG